MELRQKFISGQTIVEEWFLAKSLPFDYPD